MELTLEQKLSCTFDRHLSVTANAGSGKTKVLVDRYIDILQYSFELSKTSNIIACNEPSEIVAITFTKKAASEMKEKINHELNKRIQLNDKYRSQLIKIRDKMIYANISTIHSFCHKLMKDYPIEANISPNFGELSESETKELIENTINGFLHFKTSNSNYFDNDIDLLELIFLFEKQNLVNILKNLAYDEYNLNKLSKINFDNLNKQVLEEFEKKIPLILYYFNDLIFYLNKIITQARNYNLTPKQEEAITNTEFIINSVIINNSLTSFEILSLLKDFFAKISESSKTIFTKDFKIQKLIAKKIELENEIKNKIAILIAELNDFCIFYEYLEYSDYYAETTKKLINYALEIVNEVNNQKDIINKYNFEDMLIKALHILENEDVIEDLKTKIKYLMIDEFQDTNEIQYDIIKKLTKIISNNNSNNNINLFIVGDDKQSIYGFRKADVRIFSRAMQDIYLANNNLIKNNHFTNQFSSIRKIDSQNEDAVINGNLKLRTTFRLLPIIGAFNNQLFSKCMISSVNSDFSVNYENFVIGRNAAPEKMYENGSVNFLFSFKEKQNNESESSEVQDNSDNIEEEEISQKEYKMIANKIFSIVNNIADKRYYIEKNGEFVKPNYSDIFVLARKHEHLSLLADELRKLNIPFLLNGGSNYYNSQEIKDLICYFNFLMNANDDISLLSLLKSPFFDFNNTELLLISLEDGDCFYSKLINFVKKISINSSQQDEINKDKIIDTYKILSESRAISPSMDIHSIVRDIIIKTNYLSKISNDFRFEQIVSNIEKLIEFSRNYEKTGFKTMFDFISELNYNAQNFTKDGEALVIRDDNSLNLMTIHSAKGLDAPIVFVISNNSKVNETPPSSFISDKFGLIYKLPVIIKNSLERIEIPIVKAAKNEFNENMNFEALRLLYVALTRAKDHLFISQTLITENGKINFEKNDGFYKIIFDSLLSEYQSEIQNKSSSIKLSTELDFFHNGINFSEKNYNYKINLEYEIPEVSIQKDLSENFSSNFIEFFDDINLNYNDEFTSPSKLLSFSKQGLEEYLKKYVYYLDDSKFEFNDDKTESINPKTQSQLKGTAIHYLFENIKQWLNDDYTINQAKQLELAENKFNSDPNFNNFIINTVLKEVNESISTNFFKRNLKNYHNWRHEVQMLLPFGNDFINGFIDVIAINEFGEFEVWDWKSNHIENFEDFVNVSNSYQIQMQFYCYFLSLIYKEQNQFTARLFFTNLAKENISDDQWIRTFVWSREELIIFAKEQLEKFNEIKSIYL